MRQCSGLSDGEELLVKGKTSDWREGDQIEGWAEAQVQEELRPGCSVVVGSPSSLGEWWAGQGHHIVTGDGLGNQSGVSA